MIHKKMICFIFLFYLFPISGCMKLIDLTKTPKEPLQVFFSERKLKYEENVQEIKNQLDKRSGYIVLGHSPRAMKFLYSVYIAKKVEDFTEALMAEKFFIALYAKERVAECSVFGIVAMIDTVPFAGKKAFIEKLLNKDYDCSSEEKIKHQFEPTPKDKEFAFFAKVKEFGPSIIQEISSKISLIRYMNDDFQTLDLAPIIRYVKVGKQLLEVRNYIEELLFLLNLEEKESLL